MSKQLKSPKKGKKKKKTHYYINKLTTLLEAADSIEFFSAARIFPMISQS